MKRWLLGVVAVVAVQVAAAKIVSVDSSDVVENLTIRLSDGRSFRAPLTDAEQAGFRSAAVSSDGRYVGWTATFGNCCTSYPLPLSLVVHDGERVVLLIRREAGPSIFEWRFSPDNRYVVYEQTMPHGWSPTWYTRVRLADGQVVGRFECDPPEDEERPPKRLVRPPTWTGAAASLCVP
ncbi:MAG TPA: hypothetical protein VFY73_23635 [Ideonella sp.]|uniref:hypothetical protein n=1 Tax=Ideonella sp. TaxID=1929293 RepID=UPI002E32D46E|nr:hypothetical protein [Ideonella sp.]HEX5687016.1 hypothetical protein [Ideonella sp.]